VLRFEVAAETLALVREALNKLRRSSTGQLDDDSALLLMARQVLGGPSDDGRSSYQIALHVCPECGRGAQQGSGELLPVDAEVVAMAHCDGQHVGLLGARAVNESAHADAHVGASTVATAHADVRADAESRAKQTIPPRVRRTVLHRDRSRCVVPGCRNGLYIDVHHIELRSEGGRSEPDNLICLCGAHHRAVHRGELHASGRVSTGVHFEHADGSVYGRALMPRLVDTQAKAFAALRGLGFREGEIRGVLAKFGGRDVGVASDEQNVERMVRAALTELTTSRVSYATHLAERQRRASTST
jgi:hypothetical protein